MSKFVLERVAGNTWSRLYDLRYEDITDTTTIVKVKEQGDTVDLTVNLYLGVDMGFMPLKIALDWDGENTEYSKLVPDLTPLTKYFARITAVKEDWYGWIGIGTFKTIAA